MTVLSLNTRIVTPKHLQWEYHCRCRCGCGSHSTHESSTLFSGPLPLLLSTFDNASRTATFFLFKLFLLCRKSCTPVCFLPPHPNYCGPHSIIISVKNAVCMQFLRHLMLITKKLFSDGWFILITNIGSNNIVK